jgi:hypothetical protein
MFISPFIRLTKLENSDIARIGTAEAKRQAALLRVPQQVTSFTADAGLHLGVTQSQRDDRHR